jgi:glycosyltransferase involved in cell wall biosynthesis
MQHAFDITVLCPRFEGKIDDFPGITVVRLPLLPFNFGDIKFASFKRKIVRQLVSEADIVFNQSIAPVGMMTIKEASKQGVPVTSFIHSVEWELAAKSIKYLRRASMMIVKRMARGLYNKCSLLMIPGDDITVLMQNNGVQTRTSKVTLGVDVDSFVPAESKELAKRRLKIDPAKTVIGFCGRIAREKSLPTLQAAFDTVHKEHPDTLLLIVGEGLRNELRKDDNVIITGKVDNVVPYLQAMDIFVLPSLTETSSLSTMEAMACALPVIVTPVGNIPDYVSHEKNGWFFARHDTEDLSRKITYLIEKPELRSKLGVAARMTIERFYRWENTADKIVKLLKDIKR